VAQGISVFRGLELRRQLSYRWSLVCGGTATRHVGRYGVSATTSSMTPVAQDFVGDQVSNHDELNGYVFWGLVALFIGVPELLAAFSSTLKADIPWPTISNLVGKDLERHHHWVALLVVGLIVVVTIHTLTYPAAKKKVGRAVRHPDEAVHVSWSEWYIVVVAAAGAAAGVIASVAGASKNQLGYAIYITLTIAGVVVPTWPNYQFGGP